MWHGVTFFFWFLPGIKKKLAVGQGGPIAVAGGCEYWTGENSNLIDKWVQPRGGGSVAEAATLDGGDGDLICAIYLHQ